MAEENEKKVVVAYVVKRYNNGDIDVEDAGVEGTDEVSSEQIYKDIEDVSRIIALKRTENAAYAGVRRFFAEVEAANRRAAEGAGEEAGATDSGVELEA